MDLSKLTGEVLDAFEGICYVTDLDGNILSIGEQNWERFAIANGAMTLLPASLIGQSFFDFFLGVEIKEHFKECLHSLQNSDFGSWTQPYRCDSPETKRHMRLSITPLHGLFKVEGFLFQSIELNSEERPPLDIYDIDCLLNRIESESELDIVLMCSFCQQVKSEGYTASEWVEAEDYYHNGGHSEVRISHGVCDSCEKVAFKKRA